MVLKTDLLSQNSGDNVKILSLNAINRPISRVVIGREVDYRSRLIYIRYCFTNTTLCL